MVTTAIPAEEQSREAAAETGKRLSAGPELLTQDGEWEGGEAGGKRSRSLKSSGDVPALGFGEGDKDPVAAQTQRAQRLAGGLPQAPGITPEHQQVGAPPLRAHSRWACSNFF